MNTFLTAELRLVKGAAMGGLVKDGQPLFFLGWRDRVGVFDEATNFLAEKVVKRSLSLHTWEGYGYDLLSWFQWCQLKALDWVDATEADRELFAEEYAAASEDGTVNRKLTIARRFYEFAFAEGWYKRDIGSSVEERQASSRPIDDDPLVHTRPSSRRKNEVDTLLIPVSKKDVVKPLLAKHLRKLLEHLGPTLNSDGDLRSVRDRLICDLAYVSGTRLGDLTKLKTVQFLSICVEPNEMLEDFALIVEGKKRITRRVTVPGWLVVAVQKYISGEREASLRSAKRKAEVTTALFLGHPKSKAAGKPITRSAIQKMFSLACLKCGITELREVVDEETGNKLVKTFAAHSIHDLRHNCAVLTYHAEKAQGNSEPWKVVQIKLGHRSLKVTMDTYLAHVNIFGQKQGLTDIRRLLGIKA
jgi:site-specific recombinase XerD